MDVQITHLQIFYLHLKGLQYQFSGFLKTRSLPGLYCPHICHDPDRRGVADRFLDRTRFGKIAAWKSGESSKEEGRNCRLTRIQSPLTLEMASTGLPGNTRKRQTWPAVREASGGGQVTHGIRRPSIPRRAVNC